MDFAVKLYKEDNQRTYLRFEKMSGSILKFHELVKFAEGAMSEIEKHLDD